MTHHTHTYIPSAERAGPEDVVNGPGRLQGRLVLRTERLALVDFGSATRWLESDQVAPSKRERRAAIARRQGVMFDALLTVQRSRQPAAAVAS